MTNKELFKLLTKEQQMSLIRTLSCYNEAHIEYYYGEYHIEVNYTLLNKYPEDHKVLNVYTKKEVYGDSTFIYLNEWYDYVESKRRNKETNENGVWQKEFEAKCEPIFQEILNKYLMD